MTEPGLCGTIAIDVTEVLKSNDCFCFYHHFTSVFKGEITLCKYKGTFGVTYHFIRDDTGQDMVQWSLSGPASGYLSHSLQPLSRPWQSQFPSHSSFFPPLLYSFAHLRTVLKKSPVVCVLVSRQHVWLRRKCVRGDERHVKVPGFWRSINLPIRPEITWPDLTLPDCLCPKREEEWEEGRTESVSRWKREWNIMDGTCEWVYLMEECLFDLQPATVQNIWSFDCYLFYENSNRCP